MSESLILSIVICTYNRSKYLAWALESVCPQVEGHADVEVMVVDNNSTDDTREVVKDFENRYAFVRYVFEGNQGLSHARNRGWQEARGRYVGYLDDDGKACEGWVERAMEIILRQEPHVFGGPYYAFYEATPPAWFKQSYASNVKNQDKGWLSKGEFISGGNFFAQRLVLERLDGFNPALGVKGKKRMVGEETELMIRLWNTSADAAVYYDPDLCILHLVKPERMSLWWDFKRKLHYGWVRSRVFSARYRPLRLDRGRLVWILQMAHRILFACARPPIALLRGLAKAAVGVWLRDRKRYPFWQNYYYEVVFAEAMAVTSHLAYLLRPGGLWKSLRDTPLSTHQEQRQC